MTGCKSFAWIGARFCTHQAGNNRWQLKTWLLVFSDAFAEGLGTLKGVKMKIYVGPAVEPKYIKASLVPYALRNNVELELEMSKKG